MGVKYKIKYSHFYENIIKFCPFKLFEPIVWMNVLSKFPLRSTLLEKMLDS